MQFKNKFIPVALALAFAGSAYAQDTIKIGHVAPVSGPNSHLGKDMENGARMAVEDLAAKGVKIGGKPVKFVVQFEDDAGDPKQGTTAAQAGGRQGPGRDRPPELRHHHSGLQDLL